jgi:hypothetical protein
MTCLPRRPVAPLVSATPASNALLVLPHAAPLVSSRSPLLSLRVGMIQTDKINSTLKPLIQHSGGFPQRILYCCRRVEMIQTDADTKALIKKAPFYILILLEPAQQRADNPTYRPGDHPRQRRPATPYENDFYRCPRPAAITWRQTRQVQHRQLRQASRESVKIYKSHGGGRVENTNPLPGTWLVNRSNSRPQIRVFILPDKDSIIYGRIKLPARQRDWDTRILESINFLRPPAL